LECTITVQTRLPSYYTINELRKYKIAAGRQMAIKSTYFKHKRIHLQTWRSPDGHTFNQIDHCLIDGRHFSDVIDVMARKDANSDSDHMLVVIKLRARIYRASNTKPQQLRRFAANRLKDRDVASRYYEELLSELQGVQPQPLSLDEKCKKLEETIQRVATNTIGYTRKKANKKWFDEECARVTEETNAARERAIQIKTR
jgi:type I restriction-modification system DNA methylase subunit